MVIITSLETRVANLLLNGQNIFSAKQKYVIFFRYKFSREGRWRRKRVRRALQLGSDRQTRDPLGVTQSIENLWTLKASAFSSRCLFQKYPRIQTTPFTKGQVKKPRYQVPITVTVIFIFIFMSKFEGMANVPFSTNGYLSTTRLRSVSLFLQI